MQILHLALTTEQRASKEEKPCLRILSLFFKYPIIQTIPHKTSTSIHKVLAPGGKCRKWSLFHPLVTSSVTTPNLHKVHPGKKALAQST